MSRLIVKNIGKTTTEKQLRDLFGSKGEVTDVRIPKTNSGKSRQFAFIGYRNEQQCLSAQKYFDSTYINTSKMNVEIAKSINDPTLNSSKSRHTQKKLQKIDAEKKKAEDASQKATEKEAKKKAKAAAAKPTDHSKLEFLEVMKSRSKADVWGNDDIATSNKMGHVKPSAEDSDDNSDSDDDSEYDQNIALASGGSAKGNGSDSDGSDDDGSDMEDDNDTGNKVATSGMSDMDYLRAKMTSKISEISDSEAEDDGDDEVGSEVSDDGDLERSLGEPSRKKSRVSKSKSKLHTSNAIDDIATHDVEECGDVPVSISDSNAMQGVEGGEEEPEEEFEDGRLFVRNLPFGCSEEELTELFATCGPVSQVSHCACFSSVDE
jgi:multiple RNA-binding domain-containing protein 1